MMRFWTYDNLAAVTQGTWLVEPDDLDAQVTGLWHDTREIKPGQAYLAIAGENFDGHAFIDQAFEAGATLAIVQQDVPSAIRHPPSPILKVDDTVKTLQDLARAYRDELKAGGCKVIAIAGSNGKTTTRHLIHHVLTHAGLKGIQSPKSFNNHLGVPLTLLSALPGDDFVAAEIGTNHPGEIDFLSAIARPDIAVITSIGEEHLEFFKTVANVAKEEAAILGHVVEDGRVFVPDADWNRYLLKHYKREDLSIVFGWYEPEDDALGSRVRAMGGHMQSNIALAGAVANNLGVDLSVIDQAVRSFKQPSGRGEFLYYKDITVIHDAYNANPSSTQAAIALLGEIDLRRTVMVFGDMLELGERSIQAHQSMGIQAETAGVDYLITIGPHAKQAGLSAEKMRTDSYESWSDDLPEKIAALLEPGDTVLLKASRGMALERLIPAIERRFGTIAPDEPT